MMRDPGAGSQVAAANASREGPDSAGVVKSSCHGAHHAAAALGAAEHSGK